MPKLFEHLTNFVIPGQPVAMGRPRFTKSGRCFTPKKTADAIKNISSYASEATELRGLDTALHLGVTFVHARPKRFKKGQRFMKTTRPDVDNLIKTVKDGITNAGIWKDDSFVVSLDAYDYYAATDEEPHTTVLILKYNEN